MVCLVLVSRQEECCFCMKPGWLRELVARGRSKIQNCSICKKTREGVPGPSMTRVHNFPSKSTCQGGTSACTYGPRHTFTKTRVLCWEPSFIFYRAHRQNRRQTHPMVRLVSSVQLQTYHFIGGSCSFACSRGRLRLKKRSRQFSAHPSRVLRSSSDSVLTGFTCLCRSLQ